MDGRKDGWLSWASVQTFLKGPGDRICSVWINPLCTLVPSDGHSPCPAVPSQAVFGLSPVLMSLYLGFTTSNNSTQWDLVGGAWCELAKPSRGVSCMVEGRRTPSVCGVGHWVGHILSPWSAHSTERGVRDVGKTQPQVKQQQLCSAFLEAGKWLCFILVLLSQHSHPCKRSLNYISNQQ